MKLVPTTKDTTSPPPKHVEKCQVALNLGPPRLLHMAAAPGKQLSLTNTAWRKWARLARFAAHSAVQNQGCPACIEPLPQDKRLMAPAWQKWPFSVMYEAFLLQPIGESTLLPIGANGGGVRIFHA